MKKILTIIAILISCSSQAQQVLVNTKSAEPPKVRTSSGVLSGIVEADVISFKGIPYAAAPVGVNRWRPPQPFPAWKGVRDATKFGNDPPQRGFSQAGNLISERSSEDCLFLNIWEPANVNHKSKLPVMVWIYGGAFVFGSGSQPGYNGSQFARQGVILITINYRLGRLGFFAHPALNKEHPNEPKGNYAYMDQIAALQWVKKNIAAFGGDANNVTVFGESAGGVSVQSLLTIPRARGLFHKAIVQSGGGRDGVLSGRPISKENFDYYYPVSAETIGLNFARRHGILGTDAIALKKLRALSVDQIVDGGQETDGPGGAPTYSGPIVDGKLVIETTQNAYKSGKVPNVSLMIGSNSAEREIGFINANTKEELLGLFGGLRAEAKAIYDPDGTTEFTKMRTLVITDKVWAEPARFTAKTYALNNLHAYVYLFSYVSPSARARMRYGAAHASEIAYVFNNIANRQEMAIELSDEKVARIMNSYWTNFAKTGNPNGEGLTNWPMYTNGTNKILEIQADGSATNKTDPVKTRMDLIEKAINTGNLH